MVELDYIDQLSHESVRQVLKKQTAMDTLRREVTAWQDHRNHEETWIDWRFTTADAG
jgi:hypothetical protein